VRDCARAHILATESKGHDLQGQRIIVSRQSFWFREKLEIIKKHFEGRQLKRV